MVMDALFVLYALMVWISFRWLARALIPQIGWVPHATGLVVVFALFVLSGSAAVMLFGAWDLFWVLRGYVAVSRLARDPREAALLRSVRDPDSLIQLVTELLGKSPSRPGGGPGGLRAGAPITLPPPLDFKSDHAGFLDLLSRMMSRHPAEAGLVSAIYTAGLDDVEIVAQMLAGHIAAIVAPRSLARSLASSFVSLLLGVIAILALFILDRLSEVGL